ncbi:hypothetical protein QFZ34_003093 [Phyllobacterium ifriqiyense]|uniref:Uncharacterized protein n=1 Tax=Phyllobacterium ifriqiyense TaxID=314238 RepID=A0ABU0SBR1_9HYPH|nr:hypothetical protein [Phyllobacterium ifriqiyense]
MGPDPNLGSNNTVYYDEFMKQQLAKNLKAVAVKSVFSYCFKRMSRVSNFL